jgi:transposase
MRKERKHYTAEEKAAILRRHLLDKVPVSDLCEELGLQPTVFYRWQKEFFENGAVRASPRFLVDATTLGLQGRRRGA